MKQKVRVIVAFLILFCPSVNFSDAQDISHSFELRYVTGDSGADGETDFKGETSVFDTEERVEFLGKYAEYAEKFFNDQELDRELVTDDEASSVLASIKPQPLPTVRSRIPLDEWKWLGYRTGQHDESLEKLSWWTDRPFLSATGGKLFIGENDVTVEREIKSQTWRFMLRSVVSFPADGAGGSIILKSGDSNVAGIAFDGGGGLTCRSEGKALSLGRYEAGKLHEITMEVDLAEGRYNVYVDDEKRADFVPLDAPADTVKTLVIEGSRGEMIDSIWGVGYFPTDIDNRPYTIGTFLDESFGIVPDIAGWQEPGYHDTAWEETGLPHAHGSERNYHEDLYLRTQVTLNEFDRAVLNVEVLDPGGEVWVNGTVAAVLPNRHPARIDITRYLKKNAENTIAVKVRYFNIEELGYSPMGHTPLDFNMGWFAGRMSLDLTAQSYIDDVFVFAEDVTDPAPLRCRIAIANDDFLSFKGEARVAVTPWFPEEDVSPAVTAAFPVVASSGVVNMEETIRVPSPRLWTPDAPNLYKVAVTLVDEAGAPVDDYVVTSGIRTLDQEGGTFRLNGKPDMLNGAQIFGFRPPMENLVTWCRSCPPEWLVKEILMIKEMNGNLLRVHIHAWESPAKNINDPRLPEYADQLGMMLIWGTPAWVRTGRGWNEIDFEGYPKYMRQVYNHASIVMWEVSNHPNKFKQRDYSESNLFCEKAYKTVYPVDPSRIISYTSFIGHLHYHNDAGTLDRNGGKIIPSPAWTAKMVTRGNQDSFTGYGKEWSVLRNLPTAYYSDFLNSKERAYFNFEHEESIGQPNWNLVKGKPWYKMQSYEWKYDDGSIGRKLTADEWRESQAWQAFSAYESMKKQRWLDYDGFSWCCLHGGANTVTYKKPLIDYHGHPKLAWYTNKMVFQRILAGSGDVDVVYGPGDTIKPIVMNLGDGRTVDLTLEIRSLDGSRVDSKLYQGVVLPAGRTVTELSPFKPTFPSDGYYAVEYIVR